MRARLPKSCCRSRTLWVFGVMLLYGVLALVDQFLPQLISNLEQIAPAMRCVLNARAYALVLFWLPILAVLLRLATVQPVEFGAREDFGAGGKV